MLSWPNCVKLHMYKWSTNVTSIGSHRTCYTFVRMLALRKATCRLKLEITDNLLLIKGEENYLLTSTFFIDLD